MARPFSVDWENRMDHHRPRPTSDSAAQKFGRGFGGFSEQQQYQPYRSTEAQAIDRWFEDLSNYEKTLEQMAEVKLLDSFKEEMRAVDSWFVAQSDCERTTVIYALLRHCTQLQVRFFITVLQQMAKRDPIAAILSPRSSLVTPRSSTHEEDSMTPIGEKEQREFEASKRLLEKLPPLHNPTETANEEESNLTRRLYDRHTPPDMSREPLRPLRPAPPVPPAMTREKAASLSTILDPLGEAPPGLSQRVGAISVAIPLTPTSAQAQAAAASFNRASAPATPFSFAAAAAAASPTTAKKQLPHPVATGGGAGSVMSPPISPRSSTAATALPVAVPGTSPPASGNTSPTTSFNPQRRSSISLANVGTQMIMYQGKPLAVPDMDIAAWLKSLRLHKYSNLFETMVWDKLIDLDDQQLQDLGMAALGARRKILKAFESIKSGEPLPKV